MRHLITFVAVALFLCGAVGVQARVTHINVPGAAGVKSWFSSLTMVALGDPSRPDAEALLSISGTIGTPFPSPPGPPVLVPGGIGAQTTQALNNIVSYINYTCQLTLSDECEDLRFAITKCRVYTPLLSNDDEKTFEAAWVSFFNSTSGNPNHLPPARMSFQGAKLVIDAQVEIECDAVIAIH
eukprot:TRINITY_DN3396_c0_g1_i1.p1 TRINITY_DN3396_c0_g1~~TRINITY_DN3396_c0_g1_i1.p1  ORF type:complete len:204 (+),score=39.44 TRINITY_DN3396_c0_g1_i1:64-612(+)